MDNTMQRLIEEHIPYANRLASPEEEDASKVY